MNGGHGTWPSAKGVEAGTTTSRIGPVRAVTVSQQQREETMLEE